MVRPIVSPTVPAGKERVRLCLHAGNTLDEVERLCKEIEAWVSARLAEAESGAKSVAQEPSRFVSKL